MYTCICTCIHVHIHVCVYVYMYIYMYMYIYYGYLLLTHNARLLECENELDMKFLTVFIKCGTSAKKYMNRQSSAYGLIATSASSRLVQCI